MCFFTLNIYFVHTGIPGTGFVTGNHRCVTYSPEKKSIPNRPYVSVKDEIHSRTARLLMVRNRKAVPGWISWLGFLELSDSDSCKTCCTPPGIQHLAKMTPEIITVLYTNLKKEQASFFSRAGFLRRGPLAVVYAHV